MLAFVAHPLAEIGQLLIAGIDDDRVKVGVDDDQIAFLDDAARVFGADHCRQSEAAREDRRVRRRAAELGDESGKINIGAVFKAATSAGARSCAIRIKRSPGANCLVNATRVGRPPASASTTRSTTCRTSVDRSRRYSSSIASNCLTSCSSWIVSAHSALISLLRIRSRGASASSASPRIRRCRSRNALHSARRERCPTSARPTPRAQH